MNIGKHANNEDAAAKLQQSSQGKPRGQRSREEGMQEKPKVSSVTVELKWDTRVESSLKIK